MNPPTEQVARDNRVREKIVPPTQTAESAREKPLSSDEKQLKKPSWDPSEHPDYHDMPVAEKQYGYQEDFEQLVKALSADSYMADVSELGYSMHIQLPRELLEDLEKISEVERTKGGVVAPSLCAGNDPESADRIFGGALKAGSRTNKKRASILMLALLL